VAWNNIILGLYFVTHASVHEREKEREMDAIERGVCLLENFTILVDGFHEL
jgi:hypothetical protein